MSKGRGLIKALAVICASALLGLAICAALLGHFLHSTGANIAALFSAASVEEAAEDGGGWAMAFAQIDLGAGPVDLVVTTGDGSFLVRDPDKQRRAADAGFPDYSARQGGLLLMSILFLSPPATRPGEIGLAFLRDGKELAKATCWSALCASDPALKAHLEELAKGAPRLATKSALIDDHKEYLALYRRLERSSQRFGALEPATPEPIPERPDRIYIRYPDIYLSETLNEQTAQPYFDALITAFQQRFHDRLTEFEIDPPEIRGGEIMIPLLDCATGELIPDQDDQHWLSESHEYSTIRISISATTEFADEIARITDWSFLPQGPASDIELKPDINDKAAIAALKEAPGRCIRASDLDLGGALSVWTEKFPGYFLSWTEIEASPTGAN